MTTAPHGVQASAGTPESDFAHGANVGEVGEQGQEASLDCRAAPHTGQAFQVLDGEVKAAQYLARLYAGQAAPDELALIVAPLYGATLRGFARLLQKVLEECRDA